jgi:hypothetical protein
VTDGNQGQTSTTTTPASDRFEWHPVYAGKSFDQVLRELTEEISRDQRSYKLAMDGAEASEHDSLVTVVDLERRWSEYEFDWAEMDPKQLASRILKFEQECERQRRAIPFADYRASGALMETGESATPANPRAIPVVTIGVAILVILLLILLLIIVF